MMPARPLFLTAATCCLSLVLLLAACENETEQNRVAVVGRWEVHKALRNQKETETLAGTYFEFKADGKMQTNLPVGTEEPADYTVQKNEIVQNSTPPISYLIQNVSDSALTLGLELRGMEFQLFLFRAAARTEESAEEMLLPVDSSQLSE